MHSQKIYFLWEQTLPFRRSPNHKGDKSFQSNPQWEGEQIRLEYSQCDGRQIL